MLAYERAAWTDEHLNPAPSKDHFELPEVEGGHARWRWIDGSEWRIDGVDDDSSNDEAGKAGTDSDAAGWIYYDNKWRDGRRGQDGWGRYTRRRKWYRDAELVEVTPSTEVTPSPTPKVNPAGNATLSEAESTQTDDPPPEYTSTTKDDTDTTSTKSRKRRWFQKNSRAGSDKSSTMASSGSVDLDIRSDDDDIHTPLRQERENEWGLSDDFRMELG